MTLQVKTKVCTRSCPCRFLFCVVMSLQVLFLRGHVLAGKNHGLYTVMSLQVLLLRGHVLAGFVSAWS
jgi:hypothetical protein